MTTFISTPRRRPVLHRCLLALALSTATVLPAMASPFTLQSNTVILEEREGRTSFNITNPGNQPILLLSKVENLDDQAMAGNVLVTPAVTRIDPGQSQIINFALKKGVTLDREYMLRASFEGVAQKAEQGMRMPIRQQIGFIIQPRSVAVELRPWQDLRFQADGRQLTVRNSGRHVIRMGPTLTPGLRRRRQPAASLPDAGRGGRSVLRRTRQRCRGPDRAVEPLWLRQSHPASPVALSARC